MRAGHFALLLVGVLFALSDAFTLPWKPSGHDVTQGDSRAVSSFENVEAPNVQHLETRRARGSRPARKRPAKPARKRPAKKKAPKKKKKPTAKKKAPKKTPAKNKTPTKPGQKKPAKKRPAKGKPTGAKKPTPSKTKSALPKTSSAAACKYSPKPKPGTKKPNKKLQARIDPDPCRSPSENEQIMIENYNVARKAAAKKFKPLLVNHMYLFLVKQGPKLGPKHHAVVVGKVMKVGNQLGMEATMQQLGKPVDENGKAVRHENAKVFCGSAVGGVCNTGPYRRIACGRMQGKYKFVAGASVEFADPEHFIQKGEEVFMAEKPYNVLTWNCQVYAKKLINVTKLKPGQIAELRNEQAQPSVPQGAWSDDDSDWGDDDVGYDPYGGFRVINAMPEPFDPVQNNGDRMTIE